MKKTITLLTLLLAFCTVGFTQFIDDFDDGSFSDGPIWNGDTGVFIVNTDGELQLMDNAANTTYLSADVQGEMLWEFYFSLDFLPSGNNQLRIFLNCSNADLSGSGYFLQIGESGSDDAIELRKTTGSSSSVVLRGTDGTVASKPKSRVRVIRDAANNWELLADHTGGTNFISEGTANDNTYPSGDFFGFYCQYTSTNNDAFIFDDIRIDTIITMPPKIQSITPISNTALDVRFTETVISSSAENTANYTVANVGNPATATLDAADATLVHLTGFSPAFTNGQTYTLNVTGVADLTGNLADDSESFSFFIAKQVAPFDILINEFLADADANLSGFQSVEYIELYNRSNKAVELSELQFSDGANFKTLPQHVLAPSEYVILTDEGNENLFTVTTLAISISLSNGSDEMWLQNLDGQTIHRKAYNSLEVEKGFSTELVNPDAFCMLNNWQITESPLGGTPGSANSVLNATADQGGPNIICVNMESENSIRILFDEILDENTAQDAFNYEVDNNIGSPTNAMLDATGDAVILNFNTSFDEDVIYAVSINNVSDCTGTNPIGTSNIGQFSNSTAQAGDLIINEILYDAPTGGVDFIEIYNNSDKIISLNGLQILEIEDDGDDFDVDVETRCPLLPGEYIAFSEDPQSTIFSYPLTPNPDGILSLDLPAFDAGSSVYLLGEMQLLGRDTIDGFTFNNTYHNPLLGSTKGVSLERIDFDLITQNPNNWQSAVESVGWATPAYENSQRFTGTGGSSNKCVIINQEVFSPDGDGYQDFLLIDYDLDAPGYIANVRIFDTRGRQVKELINNQFLQPRGFFRWNGDTDEGEKARIGIYIVRVELFDVNGKVTRCKQPCVVAGNL